MLANWMRAQIGQSVSGTPCDLRVSPGFCREAVKWWDYAGRLRVAMADRRPDHPVEIDVAERDGELHHERKQRRGNARTYVRTKPAHQTALTLITTARIAPRS